MFDYRNPRAMISICHSLLGIPLLEAKAAFSDNIQLLLNRVNQRQDKDLIEDGVRLIGSEG